MNLMTNFSSTSISTSLSKASKLALVWWVIFLLADSDFCLDDGPGGTHILGRTGMCRSNGSLFLQEILKHGSRFLPKKSLNMGQLFWLSPKLRDFRHAKTQKIAKFLKNRPIFEAKSLKMGTLFGQNHP